MIKHIEGRRMDDAGNINGYARGICLNFGMLYADWVYMIVSGSFKKTKPSLRKDLYIWTIEKP